MTAEEHFSQGLRAILEGVSEQLRRAGIEIEVPDMSGDGEGNGKVRVAFVSPDLREAVDEMGQSVRDQVVMVRVDEHTLAKLDAWVAIDAVKSRSEAAALFIREGLKVRQPELSKLEAALAEVEEAKERLRKQAREVLGGDEASADE
ncbi:MAG: hypothetical protein KTR31_40945 [Myxococcales bacterium]|nr:hypothetical protein [Myxococcales bacterium]